MNRKQKIGFLLLIPIVFTGCFLILYAGYMLAKDSTAGLVLVISLGLAIVGIILIEREG